MSPIIIGALITGVAIIIGAIITGAIITVKSRDRKKTVSQDVPDDGFGSSKLKPVVTITNPTDGQAIEVTQPEGHRDAYTYVNVTASNVDTTDHKIYVLIRRRKAPGAVWWVQADSKVPEGKNWDMKSWFGSDYHEEDYVRPDDDFDILAVVAPKTSTTSVGHSKDLNPKAKSKVVTVTISKITSHYVKRGNLKITRPAETYVSNEYVEVSGINAMPGAAVIVVTSLYGKHLAPQKGYAIADNTGNWKYDRCHLFNINKDRLVYAIAVDTVHEQRVRDLLSYHRKPPKDNAMDLFAKVLKDEQIPFEISPGKKLVRR